MYSIVEKREKLCLKFSHPALLLLLFAGLYLAGIRKTEDLGLKNYVIEVKILMRKITPNTPLLQSLDYLNCKQIKIHR